jgi:hypothetical protein
MAMRWFIDPQISVDFRILGLFSILKSCILPERDKCAGFAIYSFSCWLLLGYSVRSSPVFCVNFTLAGQQCWNNKQAVLHDCHIFFEVI